jgi:hypothetical protein
MLGRVPLGEEKETCITLLQQFEEAIRPLARTQPCSTTNTSLIAAATILYVSSKISTIFLNTCGKPSELQYDAFTPQFFGILDTIEPIILDAKLTQLSQARPRTFKFDAAMVLPLHLTALKCRNPQIRRRAIASPLDCPVREGAWDGLMLAKVDEKLMLMEEEGIEEGSVVSEEKRWRLVKIEADLQRRWIRAQFSRGALMMTGCGSVVRSRRMCALLGDYGDWCILCLMIDGIQGV